MIQCFYENGTKMPQTKVKCDHCEASYRVDSSKVRGQSVKCKKCGKQFVLANLSGANFQVFLSYSNVDRPIADQIVEHLENQNLACWIAPRNVTPGQSWANEIVSAIKQCRVFLLVFTKSSNKSKQVIREVEQAIDNNCIIIPFRVDDVPMSNELKYFLATLHWFDASNAEVVRKLKELTPVVKAITQTKSMVSAGEIATRVSSRRRWIAMMLSYFQFATVFAGGIAIGWLLGANQGPSEMELRARRQRELAEKRKSLVSTLVDSFKNKIEAQGDELVIVNSGMELSVTTDRENQQEIENLLRQLSESKGLEFPEPTTVKSQQEKSIELKLKQPVDFQYDETPFIEIMDELQNKFAINIRLDQSAREDFLTEDEPVTFYGKGQSFEAAFKSLLREKNAGLIVKNDALQIISLDTAQSPEFFETYTYDVSLIVEHDLKAAFEDSSESE